MNGQKLKVKCPTCRRYVEWAQENVYRPFCSERCKLIDLGEWANEEKKIPGEPISSDTDREDPFFQ